MNPGTDIYAFAREHAFNVYPGRLIGNPAGTVLVAYTEAPSDAARNAFRKSFERLGFGPDACTFADLAGASADEVFDIVEGVDPLALVASDETAAAACAQAAGSAFPLLTPMRLFGREARAFADVNAMFGSEADRQLLWHLLKSLA